MAFGGGGAIGEAFVIVRPDTRGFAGETKRGILGPMKGAAVAAAGAFAAIGAAGILKDVITSASGLNETISKTKVVFGPAAKSVLDFGAKASKALGQSRQEATEAAATFGNLFVSMRIGQQPAAQMSTKLVQLASDLASFNNVSPTEALDALRSGLVGETEPLRRFGVNLNDAALRQEALNQGLVTSTKTVLPPAAKAQAAYALILQQTKTAQGDFARTSGGLANQQRILSAQFTDLKAKIGSGLLPVATRLVTFFNSTLIPAVQSLGGTHGPRLRSTFSQVSAVIQTRVLPVLRQFGAFITSQVIPKVQEAARFIRGQLAQGVNSLSTAFRQNRPQIMAVVAALGTLGRFILTVVGPAIAKLAGVHFRSLLTAAATAVRGIGLVVRAVQGIAGFFGTATVAIERFVNAIRSIPSRIPMPSLPKIRIPGFAKGGLLPPGPIIAFAKSGPFTLNERGRETVIPAGRSVPEGRGVNQTFNLYQQPGQSAPAFIQAAMFAARTQLRPAG